MAAPQSATAAFAKPSRSAPARSLGAKLWAHGGGLLLPLILLILWQVTAASQVFTPVQLPLPAKVWQSGIELFERGELFSNIGISVQRVLIGFGVGALIGLAIGALVGLSRLGDVLLTTLLGGLRAVPSLAWVPLLILWLKIGEDSKITLIAIGAFFPVYTTVAAALRKVDPQLVEAGRAFGLRGLSLFTTVQLPAVLPSVIAGLRLALAQSWLFLVAAELIASSMGLGFLLLDSQNNGRTDRMFLAIILLFICGQLSDAVLSLASRFANKRWA